MFFFICKSMFILTSMIQLRRSVRTLIPRLHDPANVQQTSIKLPANVFKIHVLIARHLLEIYWTFVGRLLDGVNVVYQC